MNRLGRICGILWLFGLGDVFVQICNHSNRMMQQKETRVSDLAQGRRNFPPFFDTRNRQNYGGIHLRTGEFNDLLRFSHGLARKTLCS